MVHLAVYVYFAASLFGEQWIVAGNQDFKRKDEEVNIHSPNFIINNNIDSKKNLTSGGSLLSHLHDVPVPLRVWLAQSRRDPL